MALCRKCRTDMMRRVVGTTVREFCRNRTCLLFGQPQGEIVAVLSKEQTSADGAEAPVEATAGEGE